VQGIEYAIAGIPQLPRPSYHNIADADGFGCEFQQGRDIQSPLKAMISVRLFDECFA
jgi:hypothetical protein